MFGRAVGSGTAPNRRVRRRSSGVLSFCPSAQGARRSTTDMVCSFCAFEIAVAALEGLFESYARARQADPHVRLRNPQNAGDLGARQPFDLEQDHQRSITLAQV